MLVDGLEVAPGDFFFFGGITIEVPSAFLESGPGGVSSSGNIPVSLVSEVEAGQDFALVWFAEELSNGSLLKAEQKYGILTNSSLQLPPIPSSNAPYAAFFVGEDPIRPTNLSIQARVPALDCRIEANRFEVRFTIDTRTSENVTFDLESLELESSDFGLLRGISPEVVETNGNLQTLCLEYPETVMEQPDLLTRVRVISTLE